MPSQKKLFTFLNVVLIIGMLISLFLVYEHFSPTASKFCTFGESLNCGIVNKSPYANLDGIFYLLVIDFGMNVPMMDISRANVFLDLITSNAFLGFLTLLFMLFLARSKYKNKDFLWIKRDKGLKWMRGIAIFGVLYGFYLFLIQHSILKTYCIFCLALDIALIAILITVWKIK